MALPMKFNRFATKEGISKTCTSGGGKGLFQLKNAFDAQAKKELSWLEGEQNDIRAVYESMINDPRLSTIKECLIPY